MKKYRLTKTIVYIILGILVFIFHEKLINGANFLVGGLMIMISLDNLLSLILEREVKKEIPKLLNDALIMILGIITMCLFNEKHFISVCIIWATWSIIREEWEISEAIHHYHNIIVKIINILESIFVLIISIMFIFSPTVHHLHFHIIILGFELILEVLFPYLDTLFSNHKIEKRAS